MDCYIVFLSDSPYGDVSGLPDPYTTSRMNCVHRTSAPTDSPFTAMRRTSAVAAAAAV